MINGTISNIIIANNFNYLHNCFWIVRCITYYSLDYLL